MGLIEYACYSVQTDEGLMKQADEHPADPCAGAEPLSLFWYKAYVP